MPYELRDSPFFRLRTRKKLAALLQVSEKALSTLTSKSDLYERAWKHKREKNKWLDAAPAPDQAHLYRQIDIPDGGLKLVQSRIAKLLCRVTPPPWLFSPVKGRSYVSNAARHSGAQAFWLLDIADFFPSCSANKVAHFFRANLECSPDVTAMIVRLATWEGCLPQGSPCSPILAYFSNLSLWQDIEEVIRATGLTHSVYADDITISGAVIPKSAIWQIKQSINKHGLKVKAEKEVSLIHRPAEITGVIVRGDRTMLPNRQLKRLFELRAERHRAKERVLVEQLDRQIAGHIAQRLQVERR